MGLYLLDYGAGNVQSLANSLKKLGHEFTWISSPDDFQKATVSIRSIYLVDISSMPKLYIEPGVPRCRCFRVRDRDVDLSWSP